MAGSVSGAGYHYAVNAWGTPRNTWLEDIEQSARTGAEAVGLWEGKFAKGEDDAIAEALEKHGMRAGIVMPHHWTILPTPLDPDGYTDWQTKTDGICRSVERFARFKPVGIMVGCGVSGDASRRAGPVEHVVRGLERIAAVAKSCNVTIAFEPLAMRRGAAVTTLPETIAALDAVGSDHVGILLDVFHNWPDVHLHRDIHRYVDRLLAVQVCDMRFNERSWCDRVFPGEERNRCTPFIAALVDAGFHGWYDLEIFSDDGRWGNDFPDSLWKMPHEDMLRRGRTAFERCYDDALKMLASGNRPGVTDDT